MTLHEIQQDAVERYRIKLDPCSKCWGRMHAHVKERRICKWVPKNSVVATFDLLHEIGHCETYHGTMRRAESEYAATVWAIDRMHEYGLKVMITAVGYTRVVRVGQARAMDCQMMDVLYIGGLKSLSKKERKTHTTKGHLQLTCN